MAYPQIPKIDNQGLPASQKCTPNTPEYHLMSQHIIGLASTRVNLADALVRIYNGQTTKAVVREIVDDIKLEQKHAAEEELAASQAYDKLKLDTRHSFDAMMMEITEKVTAGRTLTCDF